MKENKLLEYLANRGFILETETQHLLPIHFAQFHTLYYLSLITSKDSDGLNPVALGNLFDHIHPHSDPAKNCVLPIQRGLWV